MMTLQQIFDTSASHLLTQNAKSEIDTGRCRYRGPDGRKCAIGILITEECYDRSLESFSSSSEKVLQALQCSEVIDDTSDDTDEARLMAALQSLHDTQPVEAWREILGRIARNFDLETTVLE